MGKSPSSKLMQRCESWLFICKMSRTCSYTAIMVMYMSLCICMYVVMFMFPLGTWLLFVVRGEHSYPIYLHNLFWGVAMAVWSKVFLLCTARWLVLFGPGSNPTRNLIITKKNTNIYTENVQDVLVHGEILSIM